jgi:hypothetical protein
MISDERRTEKRVHTDPISLFSRMRETVNEIQATKYRPRNPPGRPTQLSDIRVFKSDSYFKRMSLDPVLSPSSTEAAILSKAFPIIVVI